MAALPIYVAPSFQRRKVCLTPTTRVSCINAVKTRNPLKFAGVPMLPNRSQPSVGRSSPYYHEMRRRYCCLTSFFFPIVNTCWVAKIQPDNVARWCLDGEFLTILRAVFPVSRITQRTSVLNSDWRVTHVRTNTRTTNSGLTGNASASQFQSLSVRNTHVNRENSTREQCDNAVYACVVRERETNEQVWPADTDVL